MSCQAENGKKNSISARIQRFMNFDSSENVQV